ncbi:MAG: hydrogenase nickel incorporation protein HypB [Candidatus Atribacteria bacterium]|nr:hydrogenase nickel incorporation protein HypB [Candidatus Atribacteria bacterium]
MTKIKIFSNIMKSDEDMADKNRQLFEQFHIPVINIMSSPGSGKTSLLEKTIMALGEKIRIAVLEGDLQTDRDAQRISKLNVQVAQINTDGACHLDANMVNKALSAFDFNKVDLFFIENVGNLVCPAGFDLGENWRVNLVSVPEGDDKAIKYPVIFRKCDVLLLNKIDLLPYVRFDRERFKKEARDIRPDMKIMEISCLTGEGLPDWFAWLKSIAAIKESKRVFS